MTAAAAHITLAIETSNPADGAGEVAIGRRARGEALELLAVQPLEPKGRHDDALAPAVDTVVKLASLSPSQIDRVAVSVGPGGFTALRIALVFAKMIAEAVGAECVAVPSALVVAHGLCVSEKTGKNKAERICVALASKRGSAWIASIDRSDPITAQSVSAATGAVLEEPEFEELLRSAPLDALFADEHLPESLRLVAHRASVPVHAPVFSASACLELSWSLASVDPTALAPIYPREPEAVTKWRQLHG